MRFLTTHFVRSLVTVLTLVVSATATVDYGLVIAGGNELNTLELMSLPLFTLLFGWIVFSFLLATIGFIRLRDCQARSETHFHAEIDEPDQDSCAARTAILMPVYNESPHRIFAGIEAMLLSLRSIAASEQFDFYILSDSTDHEIWLREEDAWAELQSHHGEDVNVYYRHRPKNVARKAGNIADFCGRWGSRYRYMIVLDADSLVDATTMVELVRRMEADEQIGILQVPPTPVGRKSLFARLQQFSAHVYGPIFVTGFAAWAGDEGNYWGHNAIIRIKPFLRHCSLPLLPGKPPFGGEILSHDFVEAALMLRAGWKVQLATNLGGSFEECPTTISDYAKRDQRWCQGNLQHSRLLVSEGFRPLSRLHFASGLMSYIASPIWILFTLLCVAGTIFDRFSSTHSSESEVLPRALILFMVSMSLLLLPKFWSFLVWVESARQSELLGGRLRLACSVLTEIVASILLSPIMAIYHTRFVIAALRGTNVKWSAQQRDESGVSWSSAAKRFGWISFLSLGTCLAMGIYVPTLLIWFSPLLLGLVLAIPVDVALGSSSLGMAFFRRGLLLIPDERSPCKMRELHKQLLQNASSNGTRESLFERVLLDPKFFLLHRRIQLASDADVPLPMNQQKAIEAAWSYGGIPAIPTVYRSALLADSTTLLAFHLDSQVSQARVSDPIGSQSR